MQQQKNQGEFFYFSEKKEKELSSTKLVQRILNVLNFEHNSMSK